MRSTLLRLSRLLIVDHGRKRQRDVYSVQGRWLRSRCYHELLKLFIQCAGESRWYRFLSLSSCDANIEHAWPLELCVAFVIHFPPFNRVENTFVLMKSKDRALSGGIFEALLSRISSVCEDQTQRQPPRFVVYTIVYSGLTFFRFFFLRCPRCSWWARRAKWVG